MVEALAAGLGYTLRFLLSAIRALPGLVGPAAIVFGLWFYDYRLAIIVGGVILWLADLLIGQSRPRAKPTDGDQ